jgi:hypothetical protein
VLLFFCSDEFLAPLARFEHKVLYANLEKDDKVRRGDFDLRRKLSWIQFQPYDRLLLPYRRVPTFSPYGLVYGIAYALKGLACRAPVLLAHAEATKNIIFLSMRLKLRYPRWYIQFIGLSCAGALHVCCDLAHAILPA